jgi:hypothetical protein
MRHCPLVSLQNGLLGVLTCLMGYVLSHLFVRLQFWFWMIVFVCSIDPSESGLASLMNAASGIMVICWLSSFPSSAPRGHDRASAAMWDFPGTCWSLKL